MDPTLRINTLLLQERPIPDHEAAWSTGGPNVTHPTTNTTNSVLGLLLDGVLK